MHIFQFQCESVVFYNIKLISQKSNKVILLARFFLQIIMFIKWISTLQECLNIFFNLTVYIPLFVMKFAHYSLQKEPVARGITWLDFRAM